MTAKIDGLNLDEDSVYQEIDLEGVDDVTAQIIGQEMIDLIISRTTQQNKSVDGQPFKPYKKSYKGSEAFEQYGKTNKVNMTLSGDMLGSLDVLDYGDGFVRIGFDDELESAKAHGHMTGMGGKGTIRRFFGVNKSELQNIVNQYPQKKEKIGDILEALSFLEKDKDPGTIDFLLGDFFG